MTNVNRSSQQLVDHMGRFGYTIGDLNDNRDVYVNDRDEYTVYGNVSYVGSHEHSPLKITHVYGDFKCNGNQFITSGINCPSYVSGEVWFDFTLIDNDTIGMLPNHIGGSLWLNNTKITSLRGIHERVNYIGQGIYFSSGVTHLLGILKIEGITRIGVDTAMYFSGTKHGTETSKENAYHTLKRKKNDIVLDWKYRAGGKRAIVVDDEI